MFYCSKPGLENFCRRNYSRFRTARFAKYLTHGLILLQESVHQHNGVKSGTAGWNLFGVKTTDMYLWEGKILD